MLIRFLSIRRALEDRWYPPRSRARAAPSGVITTEYLAVVPDTEVVTFGYSLANTSFEDRTVEMIIKISVKAIEARRILWPSFDILPPRRARG